MLKNVPDFKKIFENINIIDKHLVSRWAPELSLQKRFQLSAIFYFGLVFILISFFLGRWSGGFDRTTTGEQDLDNVVVQDQSQMQNQKQTTNVTFPGGNTGKVESLSDESEESSFGVDFNSHDWDLDWFFLDSSNYHCPLGTGGRSYYYASYMKEIYYMGVFGFKILTKPLDETEAGGIGEVVLKFGRENENLSEFYFPVRNDKKIKHRYSVVDEEGGKRLDWSDGKQIYALVKPNTPVEIEVSSEIVSGNTVSSVYKTNYIPKTSNDTGNISRDFPYTYEVYDTSPLDIRADVAIGVDKNTCFKIEKVYPFSIPKN